MNKIITTIAALALTISAFVEVKASQDSESYGVPLIELFGEFLSERDANKFSEIFPRNTTDLQRQWQKLCRLSDGSIQSWCWDLQADSFENFQLHLQIAARSLTQENVKWYIQEVYYCFHDNNRAEGLNWFSVELCTGRVTRQLRRR